MLCRGEGIGRAALLTKVPKAFTADTPTLESMPFEAPVVVAVGKAFVQLAPDERREVTEGGSEGSPSRQQALTPSGATCWFLLS
jgi:hypothetical protein